MRLLMCLMLPALLTGCSAYEDYKLKGTVKEAAMSELKDPDSAKFKQTKIVTEDGKRVVCMKINSKNGFGAYGGFKWALWRPANPANVMWEGEAPSAAESDFFRAAGVDIVATRAQILHAICGND